MTIKVGDQIPNVTLKHLADGGLAEVKTGDVFNGKRVVLVSVPGAYTPTCSNDHLPGYIAKADDLKSQGIDEIVFVAVNDPWVMHAWGEAQGASGKITMLPDGNGEFTKAMGLEQDISVASLGVRGKRFSMVVDNGVVKSLQIEPGKGVTVSGADSCLIGM